MDSHHLYSNHSPWLHQLKRTRSIVSLEGDIKTDVAIVGGGIAGVVTAYFVLRETQNQVLLIEGDKVAHGATGHNAGQITSYFERPFSSIVAEFGIELAGKAQAGIESAWELLAEIIRDLQLETPHWRFTGYAGCSSMEQIILHFQNNQCRRNAGLPTEVIYVLEEYESLIPEEYEDFYQTATRENIEALLETKDPQYIGVLCYDKGCMNSALFTEEVVGKLLERYKQRFKVVEMTHVKDVILNTDTVTLQTGVGIISAKKVVLCTNGFEAFNIENQAGAEINTTFHHDIEGRIGYMAGFLEPADKAPTAISYFNDPKTDTEIPYYYLTRRPYDMDEENRGNLLSVGGPEGDLKDGQQYLESYPYGPEIHKDIDAFLANTYCHYPDKVEYAFLWHGLMGYTPTRVRLIGAEPKNPLLLYNLGCNGVGILPSIYGGKKIGDIIAGKTPELSIFDPREEK